MQKYKIGILGAGNMSTAILNGILSFGVIDASGILVSDVSDDKLELCKVKGVATTKDNVLLLDSCEYVILAVKPQIARTILPELYGKAAGGKIISIMAGITKNTIREALGDVKVTRIMPNTPCLVGEGMCAVDASEFDARGKMLVMDIFGSLGKVIELPESKFHAVTALSGSGPAYVYMFIRALIDGGVNAGLSEETAKMLALQTVRGAATMSENSSNLSLLIKNVCSPGGTTIEAVNYFSENKLEDIVKTGMSKCESRSKELSENA